MNTERAIIVHTKLVHQCVQVGRSIVDTVRQALVDGDGTVADEKLEELFKPLIAFVEEGTETLVKRETDEVRAQLKERKEREEKENLILDIQADLEEQVVLNVNGKRKKTLEKSDSKRLRIFLEDPNNRQLFPEMETVSIAFDPAKADLKAVGDDPELFGHDYPDSVFWEDKYCPALCIQIEPPGQKLIQCGLDGLVHYIELNNKTSGRSIMTLVEVVQLIEKAEPMLGYSFPSTVKNLGPGLELLHKITSEYAIPSDYLFALIGYSRHWFVDHASTIKKLMKICYPEVSPSPPPTKDQ